MPFICKYQKLYNDKNMYMYTYIYVYICICMYMYIYICIYNQYIYMTLRVDISVNHDAELFLTAVWLLHSQF